MRPQRIPPPRPRSSKIAWLALFFSFMAFLMSGAALLPGLRDGRLAQGFTNFMQGVKTNLESLKNRNAGAQTESPRSEPAVDGKAPADRPDEPTQWDRLREKLGRAEELIRSQDGRAREYLENLKAEMDALAARSAGGGGRWMDQAAAKLKAVRDQVASDGPAAVQRLRELSGELKENIQTLRRVNAALHPAKPAAEARGEGGGEAASEGASETASPEDRP